MSLFCPNCGSDLPVVNNIAPKFCSNCGTPVNKENFASKSSSFLDEAISSKLDSLMNKRRPSEFVQNERRNNHTNGNSINPFFGSAKFELGNGKISMEQIFKSPLRPNSTEPKQKSNLNRTKEEIAASAATTLKSASALKVKEFTNID